MSTVSIARQRGLYTGITDQELPKIRRDISQLREQISSGKRINRPSDDPNAFAVAEGMETLGNQLERRKATIEAARPFVDRTQQELDGMVDLFAQAEEKGVRAANDSMSDSDREAIAQELRSIKDEVVDRLNSRSNDEYLFAGNRTGTEPFNDDGTVNGTYSDIDGNRTRPIGRGQNLSVNISGAELHQYDDNPSATKTITGALDGLINAVDPTTSPDDIRGNLEEVKAARNHVISKGAEAGTIAERLSTAKEQLETAQLTAKDRQSEVEDTNLARAASQLQQKQTQLQAALRAVASTKQQTSLVNFLQ
jgi:flagellar hook-associated protein 3 FlgL